MAYGACRLVIGGQWGSEGKGVIVNHIANKYDVHVRVGSPNAGHTIYYDGYRFTMRQIPVGWVNKDALLIIGRGAVIDMNVLLDEVRMCEAFDPSIRERLYVDSYAAVITPNDIQNEEHLVDRISSVGTGSGSVRQNRISRTGRNYVQFKYVADSFGLSSLQEDDTSAMIDMLQSKGQDILVEGTQGSGLSLHHAEYPYVTSVDTNAAGLMSEVGLSPFQVTGVTLVVRSYPIRVAGNSGPLPNEISWEELSKKLRRDTIEISSVSKKIRRIAKYSDEVVDRAVRLNRPDNMAFTFADYIDPNVTGATKPNELTAAVITPVIRIEQRYDVPIKYIGTGGRYLNVIDM